MFIMYTKLQIIASLLIRKDIPSIGFHWRFYEECIIKLYFLVLIGMN